MTPQAAGARIAASFRKKLSPAGAAAARAPEPPRRRMAVSPRDVLGGLLRRSTEIRACSRPEAAGRPGLIGAIWPEIETVGERPTSRALSATLDPVGPRNPQPHRATSRAHLTIVRVAAKSDGESCEPPVGRCLRDTLFESRSRLLSQGPQQLGYELPATGDRACEPRLVVGERWAATGGPPRAERV